MKLLLSALLLLGTLSLTACGSSEASSSSYDPTAALVGTWQIDSIAVGHVVGLAGGAGTGSARGTMDGPPVRCERGRSQAAL